MWPSLVYVLSSCPSFVGTVLTTLQLTWITGGFHLELLNCVQKGHRLLRVGCSLGLLCPMCTLVFPPCGKLIPLYGVLVLSGLLMPDLLISQIV